VQPEQGLAVLSRAAQNQDCIIVAISGGADSLLALNLTCDAASAMPQTQVIAWYLHHYSSDIEPERKAVLDAAALRSHKRLPNRFTFVTAKADIERIRRRLHTSWEHAASLTRRRRLRLLADRQTCTEYKPAPVVTGHNHGDFEETIRLRLVRRIPEEAMPRAAFVDETTNCLRPLAFSTRDEVRAMASERGINWFDDPSNTDLRFARNRIRHDGFSAGESMQRERPDLPCLKRVTARELRIGAADFDMLQARDRARVVFTAYRQLAIAQRFTRNHFERAQRLPFALRPFFAHLESRNGTEHIIFRRGLGERLTLPENAQAHYIRGDKATRGMLMPTPYGHKSLAKIFSELRLSPRQRRQTLVYLQRNSEIYADSITFCEGVEK